MKTNTTTAAAEAARNNEIYNKLADIAREVFHHLNAEPGKTYTPADIARAIAGGPVVREVNRTHYECDRVEPYAIGGDLTWAEGYDPATVYELTVDNFACKVNGWRVWDVLDRAARAWSIPAARRVKFEKNDREASPVVATFTVSAAVARELLAALSTDILRPVMNHVHLDTRRRVLIASDGHVLRAVQLGDALTATPEAAPFYNIAPAVFKAGRSVTITADNYATAGDVAAPCCLDYYPNWATVLNSGNYSEAGRVELTPATWRELKKAVADVAKVLHTYKNNPQRVTIAHVEGENVLRIYARDTDFSTERETTVEIDTPAPVFSIDTDARRWAKINAPTALYVLETSRALFATDPAGITLVMPLMPCDSDKYYAPFSIEPQGDRLAPLPGLDLAAAAAEITKSRQLNVAIDILKNATESDTADDLAETLARAIYCHKEQAVEILATARELLAEAEREHPATATTSETIESEPQATGEAVESVESVEPCTIKAETSESHSEPENEPQGDTIEAPEAVEVAPVWASPYAIACELPTADGIEIEPTPQADTLTPPPADTIESEGEPVAPVLTIERPRHHWHPRRALRTVLRVAALIAAALLLTLTADRVETTKADTLTTDPEAVAIADTLRAADLLTADTLTADTIATATTCEAVESVESVTPDTHKGEAIKYAHEPRKRATRHDPDTLAQVATADTIATAATCEAVESVADTLRAADLLTADTLTADTIATATTCEAVESVESVAPADTKADTIEAVSEPQGDTLTTDPVSHEGDPVAPADPEGDTLPTPTPATTGTPSPSTPATTGTPAPVSLSPAVLAWVLIL